MDMRVEKLSIQVLCHATEDEEKVMKAIENVIGLGRMDKAKISTNALKGYYGDPIMMVKYELLDPEVSGEVIKGVFSKLSEHERMDIIENCLERGKHGGKLYIRLDKQAAYNNMLKLSNKDPIRIEAAIRGDVKKLANDMLAQDLGLRET